MKPLSELISVFFTNNSFSSALLLHRYRVFRGLGLVLLGWLFLSRVWWVPASPLESEHFAKIHINMTPTQGDTWVEALQEAVFNPKCKGVLLYIDQAIGDGNEIGKTELGLQLIYRAREQKPVVSYLYGYALGSNYVLASAAEKVVAQETASIAGIGMRTARFDYSRFMESVGIKVVNHGFGKLKTEPKPDDPNYEAFKSHREGVTSQLQNWLLDVVKHNRKLDDRQLKLIDNGQWYLGMRAVNYGLCDEVGDESDAKEHLAGLAKDHYPVIQYSRDHGSSQGLSAYMKTLQSPSRWKSWMRDWLVGRVQVLAADLVSLNMRSL